MSRGWARGRLSGHLLAKRAAVASGRAAVRVGLRLPSDGLQRVLGKAGIELTDLLAAGDEVSISVLCIGDLDLNPLVQGLRGGKLLEDSGALLERRFRVIRGFRRNGLNGLRGRGLERKSALDANAPKLRQAIGLRGHRVSPSVGASAKPPSMSPNRIVSADPLTMVRCTMKVKRNGAMHNSSRYARDPKVITTGPASRNPATGVQYGMSFPVVSIHD